MRLRLQVIWLSLFFILSLIMPALGLFGVFPNDEPVSANNWPKVIVDAINTHKRVYGEGSWDLGWMFYFSGNTDDVNAFMKQLAAEKVAPIDVVLDPDVGEAKKIGGFSDEKKETVKYTYSLRLVLDRDRTLIPPLPGEPDDAYQKRRTAELAKVPEFAATVTIHCTAPIDPKALKLPLTMSASVAGKLADFADVHNRRRDALLADGKSLADQPPTDMDTNFGGGRFGHAETQPAAQGGLFGPTTQPRDYAR